MFVGISGLLKDGWNPFLRSLANQLIVGLGVALWMESWGARIAYGVHWFNPRLFQPVTPSQPIGSVFCSRFWYMLVLRLLV